MKTISLPIGLFPYALLLIPALVCADPVERTPPAIYAEQLEGELTPLEPLLNEVGYFSPEESDHGCILQEDIVYVANDGRSYELRQYAYKALSNGNLDGIGQEVFYFRPGKENIYLIQAETILPDGRRQAVPDEGILMQTPKSDRGSLIFSGRKQMRIIFPQVTEGSVTHCIVLVEKNEFRIPGQYTDRYSWERSWQTHLKRVVVSLPKEKRGQLHIVTYGTGVPEVQETTAPDGRSRLEWVRNKLPVRTAEKCDGPILQTGPYLCLSTIADWNEFGAWYAERIRESSVVDDEIKAVAKEWAGDAENEDGIIHNLAFHVANDIRYVSLEFRVGGLVPQPGAGVLENRFGDCKDKSNFLRMLLKEHGIKSHVVLINTDHSGHVQKRCPHYAYFDHAILLIEKSNGEQVFCDPTIKYGTAGMMYPGIGDRPALVIDEETGTCRWVDMPPASGGVLDYGFDLKLSGSGELSGWFTIDADGFYGSTMSKRFQSTNRDTLKYEVGRYLGYFYKPSTVMDFEIKLAKSDDQTFHLKAYFIRPAAGEAQRTVSWPSMAWLLPRLGEKKEVVREAFTWTKEIGLALKIALPASVSVEALPDEWKVETPGFAADGAWQKTEDGLRADFGFTVTESHYDPQPFAKLFTAVDASKHWIEKLVILGDGTAPVAEEKEGETETSLGDGFILLSTGEGQLDLLDHLYPLNSKPEQRKLAVEKTKAWFPKDRPTQYGCEIRLAWLAYQDKQYQESIDIVDGAVRDYGDAVDASNIGWGRYLKGLALEEVDRPDEAKAVFLDLEADAEMNEFRRGYAAYQYARMMATNDPPVAQEYYFKAYKYNSGNERWMLEMSLPFLVKNAAPGDVAAYLRDLNIEKSEKASSLVQWLAELGIENSKKLNGMELASKVYGIVSAVDFHTAVLEEAQVARLKELDTDYRNYVACRKAMLEHLEGGGYALWKGKPEKERSFDDYTKDIQKAIDDDDIDLSAYLALARICYFTVEIEFPDWVWDAARMVDYLCKNGQRELEPLRNVIFASSAYLPPKSDGTIDLAFIRAESLEREGHHQEALAVYQEIYDLGLEKRWLESLFRRWTKLLVYEGELDKAIEVFGKARSYIKEDEDFLPISILGIYALLQSGRTDEAMVWMEGLHSECGRLGIDNEHSGRLAVWVDLEDEGRLQEFWGFRNKWRPQWEAVVGAIGLPATNLSASISYPDPSSAGEALGSAISDKDAAGVADILEQLAISARWHPYMCQELQGMMSYLAEQYPDAETALQECTVAMNCDQYLADEEVKYSSRNEALDALFDLDEYEALLELAEVYYGDTTNEVHRNMYCRFAGLAAVNLDRSGTAWFGRMEEELKKPDQKADPYAVNIMSRLYRVEGRTQDEILLLQDYLNNHKIDNKTMNDLLENRLEKLQDLMNGNAQLTEAIAAWSEDYEPAWVAVFPDPELGKEEVSEVARTVEELLKPGKRLKVSEEAYLLHAARDDRLGSTARENAFYKFLGGAVDPAWDYRHSLPVLEAVMQDGRFSDSLRLRCGNYASNLAYLYAVPGYVDGNYVPLMKQLGMEDRIDKGIGTKARFCGRDPLSAASVSGWMDAARDGLQPFNRHTVYLLNLAFSDLCELGATEEIQRQIANAKKFRFETDAGNSSFSLQLKWRQQADQLEQLSPIHGVFGAFFKDLLKPDLDAPEYADVLAYRRKGLEEQRDIYRALLQHKLYDHTSLRFWTKLNDLEYLNGKVCVTRDNLEPLLDKLLAACETDSQFAAAFYVVQQLFDSDCPDCQRIYFDKTKDVTLKSGMDKTKQTVLDVKYRARIRRGDYKGALADLQSEQGLSKQQKHRETIKALIRASDGQAINDYLNTAGTDLLLDDGLIADTLHAYKISGNEAAYGLVKEEAQDVFREYVAKAMKYGDRSAVYYSVLLAEQLGEKDVLNDAWVEAIQKKGREDVVEFMAMRLAYMNEDWPAAESSGKKLAAIKPTHYDNYFYLAKAQIKQGKYGDGMKSMEPFLRYCLDSKYYQEAVELNDFAKTKSVE